VGAESPSVARRLNFCTERLLGCGHREFNLLGSERVSGTVPCRAVTGGEFLAAAWVARDKHPGQVAGVLSLENPDDWPGSERVG
jgi:hypothetical protein